MGMIEVRESKVAAMFLVLFSVGFAMFALTSWQQDTSISIVGLLISVGILTTSVKTLIKPKFFMSLNHLGINIPGKVISWGDITTYKFIDSYIDRKLIITVRTYDYIMSLNANRKERAVDVNIHEFALEEKKRLGEYSSFVVLLPRCNVKMLDLKEIFDRRIRTSR